LFCARHLLSIDPTAHALLLTFTNKAAAEMKSRALSAAAPSTRLSASTFHTFSADVPAVGFTARHPFAAASWTIIADVVDDNDAAAVSSISLHDMRDRAARCRAPQALPRSRAMALTLWLIAHEPVREVRRRIRAWQITREPTSS
jgi:hypothetical protein